MIQVKAGESRDRLALVLVTAAVIALLLLPLPIPSAIQHWPALLDALENLGHPLVFGLLAYLNLRYLRDHYPARPYLPYVLVSLAAAALGLATEVAQRYVGRDAEWLDVVNDVLGACFVMLLSARREHPGSRLPTLAAVAVALTATGPLLWTVAAYGYRAAQAPLLWRLDSVLLQRFSNVQVGAFPGLVIGEPLPDWSDYRMLIIAVRNLRAVPVAVVVRVHDQAHNQNHDDRFNQSFELAANMRKTLRIPLEQVHFAPHGRQMDLSAIRGIIVFQTTPAVQPSFSVSEIRLEK
jgi:VanZ family protein